MIYFIQGTITKNIKIGITVSLQARLDALTSSDPLICLKTIDSSDEAYYHERFKDARIHGEWFKPMPHLMAFIADLPDTEYSGLKQSRHTRIIPCKSVYTNDLEKLTNNVQPHPSLTAYYSAVYRGLDK